MTDAEKEFAALVNAYDEAFLTHNRISQSMPREPKYEQSGYYMPNEMAAFKKELDEYNVLKAQQSQAQQQMQGASSALDAWIPDFVKERLRAGATIIAPVPGGVIALRKRTNSYVIIKGSSQQDVERKTNEYIQLHER